MLTSSSFHCNINIYYFTNRIAELVEKETEAWYKMDPDPFDDRHPSKREGSTLNDLGAEKNNFLVMIAFEKHFPPPAREASQKFFPPPPQSSASIFF